MNRNTAVFIFIFTIGILYSCSSNQELSAQEISGQTVPESETFTEPSRAEQVMRAILAAYPDKVEKVEFRNGDWAVLMGNIWFYYADGKLLPESQLKNADNYRSYQFYSYPAVLPPWRTHTPEEMERFKSWTVNRRESTTLRSSFFLDALWQAPNRTEAEQQLVRINFLGKPMRIHKSIQSNLTVIETQIRNAARTDSLVQPWINSLGTPAGYSWRNIADSQSRSYHSYGLAIDLLPVSLGRRQTYWLWTSQHREDWWNVPYSERYHPPASVIRIFEANGFVWGGKWALYDTMHFEYRPEILKLNGILP